MRNLLLVLLLASSFSSPLLAQWSAELPLAVPALGPAALTQRSPAAASDGDSWFVTWTHWTGAAHAVVGLRVAADGTRTSSVPVFFGNGETPAVAWNGERYFVAWKSGYTDLEGQWVSRDGEPIGSPIRLIGDSFGSVPSISSNGREIFVSGLGSSNSIILRRDGSFIVVPREKLNFVGVDVASDGESFLVVGYAPGPAYTIVLARVSPAGEVTPVHAGTSFSPSQIVWTGEHYLLAGQVLSAEETWDLAVLRISPSGEPLGAPIRITTDHASGGFAFEGAGDGSALIAWKVAHDGPIRMKRIGSAGEVTEVAGERTGSSPHLAAANGSMLLLWSGEESILHQRLTPAGSPLDHPQVTSLSARDQIHPALASTSRGFMAAWEERGEVFATGARASRVVVAPLGPRPAAAGIAVPTSEWNQSDPAIASSGDIVLVAWLEESTGLPVKAARFTASGNVLDLVPLEVERGSGWGAPAAASELGAIWSGKYFFVVFTTAEGLRYVRITREGVLLDPEPMEVPQADRGSSSSRPPQLEPEFAVAGDRILLVWQSSRRFFGGVIIPGAPSPAVPRIEAVRLDPEGMILDSSPIILTPGNEGWGAVYPRVAANGEAFLVAWDELMLVRTASVSREGVVEANSLVIAGGMEGLTSDGDDYFLIVKDSVDRLRGYHLSPDGTAGPAAFLSSRELWVGPSNVMRPSSAAAARKGGGIAVLFTVMAEEAGVVRRIFYRATELEQTPRRRPAGRR